MAENTKQLANWIQDQLQADHDQNFALSAQTRAASLKILDAGVFPTRKDEEWRYTPLNTLLDQNIGAAKSDVPNADSIQTFKNAVPEAHHLVFINGKFSESLSDDLDSVKESGYTVKLMSQLTSDEQLQAEGTIRDAKLSDDNIFQHLALGLSQFGLFLDVANHTEVKTPLHLLNVATHEASTSLTNPVNVIHVGVNSRLKVIEQFVSLSDAQAVTIPASFMALEEGSGLEHFKIGLESDSTDHVSNTSVQVGANAHFTSHQYLLGSRLTRSNMEVGFAGPGASTTLRGIYLGDGTQHLDVRTYLDHAHPHCNSDQHFRGILNDHSRGVFNGLVLVREHAQKTDAKQSNKNLLLSRDARVDTKPQLEIFADDVKCAHGATVGELDEDALFYLQSRGISKEDAGLMLTRAFAAEITEDIGIEPVQEYVEANISSRLNELSLANV